MNKIRKGWGLRLLRGMKLKERIIRIKEIVMRKHPSVTVTVTVTLALSLTFLFALMVGAAELTLDNTPAKVCFSPEGACTKVITGEIDAATREILLQAFSFTSSPIKKALLGARKRGIAVEVIFDEAQLKDEKYRAADMLSRAHISVFVDDKHSSAHNKVIVIDRETVITGSFNFTNAAESKNAENVLVLKSPSVAALYADNWLKHRDHSRKY